MTKFYENKVMLELFGDLTVEGTYTLTSETRDATNRATQEEPHTCMERSEWGQNVRGCLSLPPLHP